MSQDTPRRLYGSKKQFDATVVAESIIDSSNEVQEYIFDCMYEHEKAGKPIFDKAAMSWRGKWTLIHLAFSLQYLLFKEVDKIF